MGMEKGGGEREDVKGADDVGFTTRGQENEAVRSGGREQKLITTLFGLAHIRNTRWPCARLWQALALHAAFHYYRLQAKGSGLKFKEICLFFCRCTFTAVPINHEK